MFLNPNLNFNFKYLLASLHTRWGQCDQNPSPDLVCWFVEDSSFLMVGYGRMGIFSSTFIAFSCCLPFPIRIYILFLNKQYNLKNTLGYILCSTSVLDPHLEFYIYIHIRLKLSIVYIGETLGMFLVNVKYKHI